MSRFHPGRVFPYLFFLLITISSNLISFGAEERNEDKPLTIDQFSRYYFLNPHGKPLILIGDYTWETFSSPDFDYNKMFRSLKSRGLNLARVWLWWGCEEFPPPERKVHIEPFLREGPGTANDGKAKYNLDKFNPAFFLRLIDFCKAAERHGIYLQLIMMDAWMIKHENLWRLNAFNADNNTNGVDGDPLRTGKGTDGKQGFCSLGNQKVLDYQKMYIKKVVETVNVYEGIYFEIANENYYSEEWELALCDYIKDIEKDLPDQHMTIRRDFPSHSYVVQKWDPELVHKGIMEKRKLGVPLLFDTDWIINKNDDQVRKSAWTAVTSGGHFSYMDDAIEFYTDTTVEDKRAALHKQIDIMAAFIKPVKPWELVPDDKLVKEGKCFVMANNEKLCAYMPEGGEMAIDLSGLKGSIIYKWYNPLTGSYSKSFRMKNEQVMRFKTPDEHDWALLISSQ
jgi:hypothetical protein